MDEDFDSKKDLFQPGENDAGASSSINLNANLLVKDKKNALEVQFLSLISAKYHRVLVTQA